MKGLYNGAYMRRYKIIPLVQIKAANLSKDALKRLAWIDWYFNHGNNAEATCRHFSLSKSVFYRWFNRFDRNNLRTLEDDTSNRRPATVRQKTTPRWVLDLVYKIREDDKEKSKYEIQAELKDCGVMVGSTTIQQVITDHPALHNTQHSKQIKQQRKRHIARMKADKSLRDKDLGSLVQIDTKHLYVLGQRFYLFVAIDCKSRYAFVWCYRSSASATAADFLNRVIDYFPFSIININTDNGSEYLLNFHKACLDLGLTHYFTHPYTPKMNGRAERMIRTAIEEFFNYQYDMLPVLDDINQRCAIFNEKYNHRRYHAALGYQIPAKYVTKLLQQKGGQPFSM